MSGFIKPLIAMSAAFIMLMQPVGTAAATYTVAGGDTLYKIGALFNTTSTVITNTNSLKSSMIYPGQKIDVPAKVHIVVSGDTLYLISKKYGVSIDSLRKANNIWTDMIYPGQRLLLPGSAAAVATATATASSSAAKTAYTAAQAASKSVVAYSAAEYDLLSRLIMAEAASESYTAKVGVGAVVINRVQSNSFPNTISSVINQRANGYYQFTPVENGWINKPADADSKKAAQEALNGADPTNGALFYFDDSATSKWIWSRPLAIKIGHMVYAY